VTVARAAWVAGAGLVVGASLWWWAAPAPVAQRSVDASTPVSAATANAAATALESATGWISGTTRRSAEQWDSWLFTQSSLRGTSLDGDWGEIGPQGLVPSLALRQRFDQLMTTLGEVNATELRAMVQSLAERDLGHDAAQVMAVWDRYVALVNAPLASRPDVSDPQQWLAVLREQQAQRRQMLGADWATAFFAADEAQLSATVQRLTEHQSRPQTAPVAHWQAPPTGVSAEWWQAQREHTLGAEAAARLAAVDAEESAWTQRLDAVRQTQAALHSRAELSALQRQQELERWLSTHFSEREQVRVRALLGV
jgi:lipase chaperone LimK